MPFILGAMYCYWQYIIQYVLVGFILTIRVMSNLCLVCCMLTSTEKVWLPWAPFIAMGRSKHF